MKLFRCTHCGQRVFFDNLSCGNCGSALGFVPDERSLVAFAIDADGTWLRQGPEGPAQRPCTNYANEGVCNWMVAADDATPYCVSCRTTRVIPALSKTENRAYWGLLEQAKRRLFYTLLELNLPVPSKAVDAANGLSFEFLEEVTPGHRVLTGHDNGVITLNIAEADDAHREKTRNEMQEPYRSLVGHFRHESGHYYWDRLVSNTPWIDEYRNLFGDERDDYAQALQRHYANPVADWQQNYISVYASSHPWEDWAECWAHYLHVIDGLETAAAWGLRLEHGLIEGPAVVAEPVTPELASLQASLIQQWLPVSQFVNAMNRSLGLHDGYPFVVPEPVVAKLEFIHRVVSSAGRGESPMNFANPSAEPPQQTAPNDAPAAVDGGAPPVDASLPADPAPSPAPGEPPPVSDPPAAPPAPVSDPDGAAAPAPVSDPPPSTAQPA